jgi:hypothetical protein
MNNIIEQYIFKVTSRKIESYLPDMDEKLTIKVSHTKFKATNFYFSLRFDKTLDSITIKDLDIKVGAGYQDLETIAYLKGYFSFIEDRDILKAKFKIEIISSLSLYFILIK